MIHLDTSFLVDVLRERRRRSRPATERLAEYEDIEVRVSVHALCELYAGVEGSQRRNREQEAVEALIQSVEVVAPGPTFAAAYGQLFAALQRAGTLISTMDLLIGTAAVVDAAPILTANARHFGRIPGLEVVSY